ncbi:hypothetical protein GCM10020255_054510 [Rhodococcus baikonurensis]
MQLSQDADRVLLEAISLPGDASVTQDPKLYGMTSGGTSPEIRSITKNGAPNASGSDSDQYTAGTGTAECSRT